jgi:3-oxoacyl-[acyl-carrier-protein] synthase-3
MGMKLIAAGHYLPEKIVTNEDMARLIGVEPDWIFERSGIRERRWVEDGRYTSDLAAEAAKDCLKRAGLGPDDVDCYIFATLSPDHMFPGIGNYAQRKIGIKRNTPCFDVRQQCTGSIFATQMAAGFCGSGIFKRVMVVGAEFLWSNLDKSPRGRDVTMLFGDGAGAMLFESTGASQDLYVRTYSAGEFANILHTDVFDVSHAPVVVDKADSEHLFPHMEGKKVFLHAVEGCATMLGDWLKATGQSDFYAIDRFMFHQANIRINTMVMEKVGIPKDKAPSNIHKYGNCSAGSIPILVSESIESGLLKPGQTVAMLGFGSGFNYALAVLTLG